MQLFWGTWADDGRAQLTEEESNHAARVLRKVPGDELWVGNGTGSVALVRLVHVSPKSVWGTVVNVNSDFGTVPGTLHLVLCPTKNLDRTEWAVEKAVELGVSHLHLALAQRSERKNVNVDRLQKIADSAAKQSLKGVRPEVQPLLPWSKLLADSRWAGWKKVFSTANPVLKRRPCSGLIPLTNRRLWPSVRKGISPQKKLRWPQHPAGAR